VRLRSLWSRERTVEKLRGGLDLSLYHLALLGVLGVVTLIVNYHESKQGGVMICVNVYASPFSGNYLPKRLVSHVGFRCAVLF
jgi:hypothetical protein